MKECVEFEQDGLQAKLQSAERERDMFVDASSRVQSGFGDLQKL